MTLSTRRTYRIAAGTAAAIALWVVGATLVVPLVLMWTDAASPMASILTGYRASLRDGVLILGAFGVVVWAVPALSPRRIAAVIEPATAESLGAMRLWIAAILLASVLWEDLASSAWLPRGMLDTERHWLMGLLHSLPIGFDRFLVDHTALLVFESVTATVLAMAAIGLFARWTVPAGALLYLLAASILRGYSWTYHTGVIPLYAMLLLSFTPCGDALSVDRWLRVRRGESVEPANEPRLRYGVGRYLVWMAIAIPYLMAGLSKLRNSGIFWWAGEPMKQMLVTTVVEPMQFEFGLTFPLLRGPGWIFGALGLAAIVSELTFVLVLVNRIARLVLPALTAAMHVGILLIQNIFFPDLIAIQAVFYDWRPVLGRLRLRHAHRVRSVAHEVAAGTRVLSSITRRQAVIAQAFIVVCFLAWATRTEKFPITAMQMFSRPPTIGPVDYVKAYAVYADGTRAQAKFEQWIGAMRDTRYRRVLSRWAATPEDPRLLNEFLDATARRANRELPPPRRIDAFELEHRRWDFRRAPNDPSHGELIRLHRHTVRNHALGRS